MTLLRQGIGLSIGKATYQGKRATQEDSFYVAPVVPGHIWFGVIADGMGGHQGGDVASQIGVQVVRDELQGLAIRHRSVDQGLRVAVGAAHQAVLRKAEGMGQLGNMGSTIIAFAVARNVLYWCSAGDSRLYLVRAGEIRQLTRDFTLGAELEVAIEGGHVSREAVEANPQKAALTSFLGADKFRTDDGSIRLLGRDFVVACTDGVYGTVGEAGIVEACKGASVSSEVTGEKVVDILFNDFLFPVQRPHQDNSTAIVLGYGLSVPDAAKSNRDGRKAPSIYQFVLAAGLAVGLIAVGVLLKRPLEDLLKSTQSSPAEELDSRSKVEGKTGQVTVPPKPNAIASREQGSGQAKLAPKEGAEPSTTIAEKALLGEARDMLARAKKASRDMKPGLAEAAIETAKKLINSDDSRIRTEAHKITLEAEKIRESAHRRIEKIERAGRPPEYTNQPPDKSVDDRQVAPSATKAPSSIEQERAQRALRGELDVPKGSPPSVQQGPQDPARVPAGIPPSPPPPQSTPVKPMAEPPRMSEEGVKVPPSSEASRPDTTDSPARGAATVPGAAALPQPQGKDSPK